MAVKCGSSLCSVLLLNNVLLKMNRTWTRRTKCLCCPANMLFISAMVLVILVQESSCVVSSKQKQEVQYTPKSDLSNYQELNLPFEEVKYSLANLTTDYNSSTKHHAKGMGHLYFITRSFMNLIFPGELYPEGRPMLTFL